MEAPPGQAGLGQPGSAAARSGGPGRGGPGVLAQHRDGAFLAAAAAAFALSLAAYLADVALHRRGMLLNWYDLGVYNDAGLIARHDPAALYTWQLRPGIKFTYPPFAALLFAAGSELPLVVLRWLMTVASLAALPATTWLAFGGLGWRGRRRIAAALAVAAVSLWTWPVLRALLLGQIELLLMALVVWDLCRSDQRRWKGAGVGLAAGIKLVPLIFVVYLVICGRLRQAATAAAAFAVTVAAGFALLPRPAVKWWLTGYFVHPGNVGDVASLVNQSLLAVIARALGTVRGATPVWLVVAVLTAAAGLAAAAAADRSGQPVAGWLTCALTGLLVSPVSWDHHWVWIAPVLVLLADRAKRATGAARWALWALFGAAAAVFGGWPDRWTGPAAFVPKGLLGFFVGAHPVHEIYHLHGLQLISWNLFVAGGLVMFAVALAAAAATTARQRPRAPRS